MATTAAPGGDPPQGPSSAGSDTGSGADSAADAEGEAPVRPPKRKSRLSRRKYEQELKLLQQELARLQRWIRHKGLKVVVIFEGRDAAGKGSTIKRITERLNPRVVRVVALGTPSDREKTQWWFQRYAEELPAAGEMVLFDRSWYNRGLVEPVMGFCTDDEYEEFLRSCPEFERMIVRSGIILIKYWFSVSDEEQERRFQSRIADPARRWKLSPMDLEARTRWVDFSRAKDTLFAHTRHQAGAMVGRRGRRQAGSPAQLHRPPAVAGPLRSSAVGARRAARAQPIGRLRAAADERPDVRARAVLSRLAASLHTEARLVVLCADMPSKAAKLHGFQNAGFRSPSWTPC